MRHALQLIFTRYKGNVDEWIEHSEPALDLKIKLLQRGKQALDFQTEIMSYPIFIYGFIKASIGLASTLGGLMWATGHAVRRKERKEGREREKENDERQKMIFELFGNAAQMRLLFNKLVVQKQQLTPEEHITFIRSIVRLVQVYRGANAKFPEELKNLPQDVRDWLESVPTTEQGDDKNKGS